MSTLAWLFLNIRWPIINFGKGGGDFNEWRESTCSVHIVLSVFLTNGKIEILPNQSSLSYLNNHLKEYIEAYLGTQALPIPCVEVLMCKVQFCRHNSEHYEKVSSEIFALRKDLRLSNAPLNPGRRKSCFYNL